ncbi:MAG: glycosyltransferase family 4 protein [Fibrobacter sp.]|nr:glycosyltransferase family 4 protein [Fibrobacter sp.]
MVNKKINLLYDATILVDGEYDNGCRSGIYFVALNVLKELVLRADVDVTLFTNPSKSAGLDNLIKRKFPEQKNLYKARLGSRFIYSLLLTIGKLRKKIFSVSPLRILLTLMSLTSALLYDTLFCKWSFLFRSNGFSTLFSPLTVAPWYLRKQNRIKKYTVLYDVIPFKIKEYESQKKFGWFAKLIKNLNSQDSYFAISQDAKKDFCEIFPQLDANKVHVTLLAASEQFRSIRSTVALTKLKEKYHLPKDKKFIFSLCTLEPRKNLVRAVRTFISFAEKNNVCDLVFVLGGGTWNKFEKLMKKSLDKPDAFDKYVVRAGYVDDEDLPIFYSYAEWFVFTSQYEGFGLPPLEAMQCGCPVITSNCSSLPEVVGDAGIMIDWNSDEQHVAAYEKYYFNDALREEYSRKGLERAKLFSWKKTVGQIVEIIGS